MALFQSSSLRQFFHLPGFFCSQALPQPIQSTIFNLSLDKHEGTQYHLVKVLLTVSPFGPSFSPQPRVYPRSSLLPTSHLRLPTSPRTLFSHTYELPLPTDRFAGPLFSCNYELLFSQLLCFDNHLRCPLVLRDRSSAKTPRVGDLCETSAVSATLYPEPRRVRYHLPASQTLHEA
jgi:hypothetical protein